MIAELNVCYTLEEFRENEMPDRENSLLFRLNNETVDCDIGDLEVSKFRPVKIKVEDPEDPEDPVWVESDGKLQLFCAETLKRYVCTKVMYYERLHSTNPFDNREIRGVQYLTQAEIDYQISLYNQGEDEVQILNVQLVKLRDEKVEIEEQIEEFRAEGKSTRYQEALLNMKEQQISTTLLSLEQLRASRPSQTLLRYDHTVDRNGKLLTPLFAALKENDQDAVEEFLRNGADPNEVDEDGYNALHMAARAGCRITIFNLILEAIDDVNAVKDGLTALMLAVHYNHLEIVVLLMKAEQIDLNVQDYYNRTALHRAVVDNRVAIVRKLLSDERIDTTLKNNNNDTPLDVARKLSNIYLTEMLEQFIYERAMQKYGGSTSEPPLNLALKAGDEDAIDVLLAGGEDRRSENPNKVNQYGQNALHIAAREGCSSHLFGRILALILNKNAVAAGGVTALMLASQIGRLKMVQTILHSRTLFSGPVDINVQDSSRGWTALHWAVNNEHLDVVHELLLRLTPASQSQIDITLRDSNGRTALDLAMENGNSDIIRLLQDAFRYLSAQDVDVDVDNSQSLYSQVEDSVYKGLKLKL